MSKGFWIIIGIIVAIFGGVLLFKGDKANAPSGGDSSAVTNHTMGQNAKNVTLLEYGDFQCPACANYFPMVEEVVKKYEADIKFQFRHLPLISIHQNAFAGSRAAEAAGLQGKFFEMYRVLYENQMQWAASNNPLSIFDDYAQQLGLNVEQFKTDYASRKVNDAINADLAVFKKTGEKMSTPSFFLNGKPVKPKSLEEFEKLITDEIAKQTQN